MTNNAIKVHQLGKRYKIGANLDREPTLRDAVKNVITWPMRAVRGQLGGQTQEFWALRDINFELKQGQVLGVVGRNGAGKSTLLKVLSRVTEPTEGYAEVTGRVGSLLEVGTGFHPELTGRENVFLNGAVLGMPQAEIAAKFDEIVDFSGVEKFIDTPVKRYSSGMYLRLAFSVAAHLEPEILVVDEVLAVGDAEFQRKCLGKMSDVANAGRTVLFVSHNMSAILRLTERAIVLENGTLAFEAETKEAVDYYMSSGFSQSGERVWREDEIPEETRPFKPLSIKIRNPRKEVIDTMLAVEPIDVEIEYELAEAIQGLRLGLYVQTAQGEMVFTSFDTDDAENYHTHAVREAGRYVSRTTIPAHLLNEGRYLLGLNASTFRIKRYFQDEYALAFNIDPMGAPGMQWGEVRLGPIRPALDWEIKQMEPTL